MLCSPVCVLRDQHCVKYFESFVVVFQMISAPGCASGADVCSVVLDGSGCRGTELNSHLCSDTYECSPLSIILG